MEWKPAGSFLSLYEKGQKLKRFYDSRKSVGKDLMDMIENEK